MSTALFCVVNLHKLDSSGLMLKIRRSTFNYTGGFMFSFRCLKCNVFHSSDSALQECSFVGEFFENFFKQAAFFENKVLRLPWCGQDNFFPIKTYSLKYDSLVVDLQRKNSGQLRHSLLSASCSKRSCLDNELRIAYFCPNISADLPSDLLRGEILVLKGYDLIENLAYTYEIMDVEEAYKAGFRITAVEEWKKFSGDKAVLKYDYFLEGSGK